MSKRKNQQPATNKKLLKHLIMFVFPNYHWKVCFVKTMKTKNNTYKNKYN